MASNRILRELKHLQALASTSQNDAFNVQANENDVFKWKAYITGPPGPYFGGRFYFTIQFPKEYPLKSPVCCKHVCKHFTNALIAYHVHHKDLSSASIL